ncbi:cutinase transcription factor 1 [Podospora didyma]|uniref:Cutinase transcription factor 1 n=1 Tax=Podospora didyma TaxID=330526 RepID=A0AAE0NC04_9PEZI|nr:cutinase transcription factor 1 [Podospora didyma]
MSPQVPTPSTPPSPGAKAEPPSPEPISGRKRTAEAPEPAGTAKVTKRRAARACVSCRARKVRCDVVEGAPCGNCRWDNISCVVQESRRRKKNNMFGVSSTVGAGNGGAEALRARGLSFSNPVNITSAEQARSGNVVPLANIDPNVNVNGSGLSDPLVDGGQLPPHLIFQGNAGYRDSATLASKYSDASGGRLLYPTPNHGPLPLPLLADFRAPQLYNAPQEPKQPREMLPFLKPLNPRIAPEDVDYLDQKGALSLPSVPLQNALLKAYVEYVHPYMPLLELHPFLDAINSREGYAGQVSLFLYQAVMFVATAFVDIEHLKEAGFPNRKAARRAFFIRTRLLYDFDYETDRLVLVQGLLLMTYWYETPDDQKDTWHWMGVAISLAHTIGLHRNPAAANMEPKRQKLWKRIWWSCFMRDRLIALGMRRPTRIKDEDFDVPMLEEGDFEIRALSDDNQLLGSDCVVIQDTSLQMQLAQMCIQKAKLCICISHMLKAQYSVLSREGMQPENTTSSTMMLHPNKTENVEVVHQVDLELETWFRELPECCQYRPLVPQETRSGYKTLAVQRNLLHMVYHTTVSALHRPQFMPTSPTQAPPTEQAQTTARTRVREAADQITRMAGDLHNHQLEKYLPTTGVTVILPAMIIHLLDMKLPMPEGRDHARRGFRTCLTVMHKLREIYAAANFAITFLEAALRKSELELGPLPYREPRLLNNKVLGPGLNFAPALSEKPSTPPPDNAPYLNPTEVSLYHQNHTYMPRDAEGNPSMMGGHHSPPHSDEELDLRGAMSPPSINGANAGHDTSELLMGGFGQEASFDSFQMAPPPDFSAGNPADFDVDQWLQFPAEGVNNSDEQFMDLFDSSVEQQLRPSHQSFDWAVQAHRLRGMAGPMADAGMLEMPSAGHAA